MLTNLLGNWGDDFPAAEDWDNDEYTGSLSDTKVFTPSGQTIKSAVGQPINSGIATFTLKYFFFPFSS